MSNTDQPIVMWFQAWWRGLKLTDEQLLSLLKQNNGSDGQTLQKHLRDSGVWISRASFYFRMSRLAEAGHCRWEDEPFWLHNHRLFRRRFFTT